MNRDPTPAPDPVNRDPVNRDPEPETDAMHATLDMDELRQAWRALDRRLADDQALRLADLRDRRLGATRRTLRPLAWGQVATMLFGFALLVLGVSAWRHDNGNPAVFVSGILMHAFGVLTLIAGGSVLGMIARIDYSAPVLQIQQQLLKLRRAFITWGMVVGLPWWLAWIPAIIALAKPPLAPLDPGKANFLMVSIGIGIAGLLATWLFRRWLQRPGREALAQRLDDAAAGRSLARAQAELAELARFERD